MNQSLYIHIPFCRKKCLYCDFCSVSLNDALAAQYVEVLCRQIRALRGSFYTAYIGGGTPTVLPIKHLERLLSALKKNVHFASEFTIEANPESLDPEKLKLFLRSGVNRISIGVQSFNDRHLAKLGRIHTGTEARQAVLLSRKAGFKNISLDLIFGLPDQTLAQWENDLKEAVALPVTHISLYSLTYEKGTPLFKKLKNRQIVPLAEDRAVRMYDGALAYLSKNGFIRYEISNFSKKGYSCKHNLNYWENNPYVGLGAGAVSYLNGTRERNISDVKKYIVRVASGKALVVFKEKLSPLQSAQETAAIKIRTARGIDFTWFKKRTGFSFVDIEKDGVAQSLKDRFIEYVKTKTKISGIRLTKKGFLFCDSVSASFL
ncbi:MAG: radical SAM family heme chaperone HemW [Candidatus Omnitrophica bacterium]|nr:radical SAM family heme chaperone HemW [Candidatus Omnitrophota bacterium]